MLKVMLYYSQLKAILKNKNKKIKQKTTTTKTK